MPTDSKPMSAAAEQALAQARRVFETSVPSIDPWTGAAKPVLFAAHCSNASGVAELVSAGYLAPAPGTCMWGYYVKGERL